MPTLVCHRCHGLDLCRVTSHQIGIQEWLTAERNPGPWESPLAPKCYMALTANQLVWALPVFPHPCGQADDHGPSWILSPFPPTSRPQEVTSRRPVTTTTQWARLPLVPEVICDSGRRAYQVKNLGLRPEVCISCCYRWKTTEGLNFSFINLSKFYNKIKHIQYGNLRKSRK